MRYVACWSSLLLVILVGPPCLHSQNTLTISLDFSGNGTCGEKAADGSSSCNGWGTGAISPFGQGFISAAISRDCATSKATFSFGIDFTTGAFQTSAQFGSICEPGKGGKGFSLPSLDMAIGGGTGVFSGVVGRLNISLAADSGSFKLTGSGSVMAPGIPSFPKIVDAASLGDPTPLGGCSLSAPVTLSNGNMYHVFQDLAVSTHGPPLSLVRTFNSQSVALNPFGMGWMHNFGEYVQASSSGVTYFTGDGGGFSFASSGSGYTSAPGTGMSLSKTATGYLLQSKDGVVRRFDLSGNLQSITDANGNQQKLTYDSTTSINRLTTVANNFGSSLAFQYDGQGRILSVRDQTGRVVNYTYDSVGSLAFSTDPLGGRTQYSYAPNTRRLARATFPDGGVIQWDYDSNQRVSSVSMPGGGATLFKYNSGQAARADERGFASTFQFNSMGSITRAIAPDMTNRSFTFDTNGNLISFTDELGLVTKSTYDILGNLLTRIDAAGNVSKFTYEPAFNHVSSYTDPLGNITQYQYDAKGNRTKTIDAAGGQTLYTYDSTGNLLTVTDPLRNTQSFTYDASGNVATARDAEGNVNKFQFDSLNRLTSVTDPLGNQTRYDYDALNRITRTTDPAGGVTNSSYDSMSRVIRRTAADGRASTFRYDGLGNLTGVTDALNNSTTYDYTDGSCMCPLAGQITAVQKANGQSLTFGYAFDRQIATSFDPLGNTTAFSFDQRRLLQTFTDESGASTQFEYDALGRLTHRTFADGTDEQFTYDPNGNMLTASNANVTLKRTYDALNRLTSETDSRTGKPTRYTYDGASRRQTMVDPDGGTTTYGYDKNGQLTQVTNPNGQTIQFTYDADGRRATQRFPNGIAASYKYDSRGNLTALIYTGPNGNSLTQSLYSYDPAGIRTSMTDLTGTHTYQYDALRRLTAAAHPAGSVESYSYDAVGNRSPDPSYVFDNADRLVSYGGAALTYDGNGNLAGRSDLNGQTNYTYDPRNRLTAINLPDGTSATYKYDPLGRRIEKNIAGAITQYFYDGAAILLEQDGGGATVARYTHSQRVDEPLVMDRGGQSYFYLADGAGSVVALADSSAAIAQNYTYDSFGRLLAAATPGVIANPFTYTGREFDPESGLYFYRARTYDADTGRFLQKDPLSIANLLFQRGSGSATGAAALDTVLRTPELGHAYAYAGNNPVNRADPFGLASTSPSWCDSITSSIWWKRFVAFVSTFFTNLATNDSPIPLPVSSGEDIQNSYNFAYESSKNYVLTSAAVYDGNHTNAAVQNLVSQVEGLDSQNLPTGTKAALLQQILQQNQDVMKAFRSSH